MAKISQKTLNKAIDYTFKSVLTTSANPKSIHRITAKYLNKYGDPEAAIAHMTGQMRLLAGTSGFVTNLGGLLTIPASLPTELVSTLYIDLRLIGGIAYLRGYDLGDARVQTVMLAALAGNAALDNLKKAMIAAGETYMKHHLNHVVLNRINLTLRHLLLKRFTLSTATALTKVVPLVGGAIGGLTDTLTTQAVASAAKRLFKPEGLVFGEKLISHQDLEQTAKPAAEKN